MKTTTILLFAVILNACGASNKASKVSNDNKISVQEALNGTFNITKIDAKNTTKNLTITFDEATNIVSGFSGCNRFFGSYIAKGESITFKELGSTKRICLEDDNKVETQMLAALGKTTNYKLQNHAIILYNKKNETLSATKQIEVKIEYKAHTRGSYKKINLDSKTVSFQETLNAKPVVKMHSSEDWNTLMEMLSKFNLKSMSTLEAPSKARQYDGAAIADFTIIKDGETFSVPSFDAGNPHKDIAALVQMVINIAKKSKE